MELLSRRGQLHRRQQSGGDESEGGSIYWNGDSIHSGSCSQMKLYMKQVNYFLWAVYFIVLFTPFIWSAGSFDLYLLNQSMPALFFGYCTYYFSCRTIGRNFFITAPAFVSPSRWWQLISDIAAIVLYFLTLALLVSSEGKWPF